MEVKPGGWVDALVGALVEATEVGVVESLEAAYLGVCLVAVKEAAVRTAAAAMVGAIVVGEETAVVNAVDPMGETVVVKEGQQCTLRLVGGTVPCVWLQRRSGDPDCCCAFWQEQQR